MDYAQTFWDDASDLIAVTEKHPFLVSMVENTLNMESFRYYVVQDALYLGDFAAALRMLSKNEGISTEDSRRLASFATGAEEAEMELHSSFFREWDISADGAVQMPHTLLYTSYMLSVVATRPHAEGLACLLPCFWVYMHVGHLMLRHREKLGSAASRPPQFDAWIDMYAGEEFEHEVRDYIAMVNRVAGTVDDDVRQKMNVHFRKACELEHMFWDQAQVRMEWPNIVGGNTEEKKEK
uniref:Thiaminase-2/PQQC domain-containing protein n=1 Tax=Corethron hystrix TaxID=216773 RepID=A0A7S1BP26_9STRA|mmetsp:Transcript_34104/g.78729  ORF Transcript_34104/g.78729 Transcript_34104/m.78729 type:complete len:238 (+) Transcript_34104:79-792(+)